MNGVIPLLLTFTFLLLDDLKEKGRDWKLKQKVLNDTLWKTRLGIVYGPVARLVVLQKQYAVNMH